MKKGPKPQAAPIRQRFGRLIVTDDAESSFSSGRSHRQVKCICDCGKEIIVQLRTIKNGHTKSCGCLHGVDREGRSRDKIHILWKRIIYRCYNKHYHCYPRYGGRGIIVSDEWLNSFLAFEQHCLECGYDPKLTIDRINNDGNYERGNIRFVTRSDNNLNRTTTQRQNDANAAKPSKPLMCQETGQVFKSAREASLSFRCNRTNVCRAIKSGGTCKGYHFRFINKQ